MKMNSDYFLLRTKDEHSGEKNLLDLRGYAPFLKITGVILGSRLEESEENQIIDLAKVHGVDLYKAILSDVDYNIHFERCYKGVHGSHTIASVCACKCFVKNNLEKEAEMA